MELRHLGRSGLAVAPLAFGGNVFGWTADRATTFDLLDRFVEAGFNLVDTADVYSKWVPGHTGGESETILGEWMRARGNRSSVVVATKAGGEMGPDRKGLAPSYVKRAVNDSLRRLQTDYIDLYQTHYDDPSVPFAETLGALTDLVQAGTVRAIGASNITAARLREALRTSAENGLVRYESLQPEYNLYERSKFEGELQQLCLDEQIGVIPYFALASGFLTGKYRSEADFGKSQRGGNMSRYLNPRGHAILAALDDVAKRYRVSPAAVSLAWLAAQPAITAPIASVTSRAQLHDLLTGVTLRLDDAALQRLTAAGTDAYVGTEA